ncbi:unnamed protein product [Linum trigynum]|uniref:Uncharacterized protein n=1 Tax=Linum trigynum TaxID=586398 RepID=A0AAV2E831_9ROSI
MDIAYHYILQDLGNKWRNNRIRLWNVGFKVEKSREENITNHPPHIPPEQWAMFIDYRLRPDTQKICKINTINKRKHETPHTGGSKKNSIRKEEMEKIKAIEATGPVPAKASRTDSLSQVLGPEHPGRTRTMGAGVAPTQVFGFSSCHGNHSSSCSTGSLSLEEVLHQVQTQLREERAHRMNVEAVLAHVLSQTGIILPPELALSNQPPYQNQASSHSSTHNDS